MLDEDVKLRLRPKSTDTTSHTNTGNRFHIKGISPAAKRNTQTLMQQAVISLQNSLALAHLQTRAMSLGHDARVFLAGFEPGEHGGRALGQDDVAAHAELVHERLPHLGVDLVLVLVLGMVLGQVHPDEVQVLVVRVRVHV
ncbi:hypothetical protein CIB48_g12160 [Xylaria polymorpha]|nr:hypothetical protein CIB48_g12160 [Xylaria polymorpha]